ncbi:glycosyltransferase family 4 protein [Pseudomonas sp. Pseusp3]|uniref:glycosyltransferase family 4 protein n=1 Tax=Pseudomonas sp. Pseusp3 TaxID=3243029 RepID=UPI0039B0450C
MLKILHLLHQSAPNISGSSTRTNLILKWTSGREFENIAITSPFQEPFSKAAATKAEYFPSIGVKVYRSYIFNNLSVGAGSSLLVKIKKTLTLPYFFIRTACIIKKENPDILHAHATFLCAIPAIILGWVFKKPVVYELRSLWFENENFKASRFTRIFAAALERYCLNSCQRIVTISDGLAEYVTTLPGDKNRSVATIKNGIDDDSIVLSELVCQDDVEQRFGYIGSVIELEGLHYVLQALKILNEKGISIDFHIYGDGSARKSLEDLSASLGVKVHFHGKFHPDEAKNIYSKLDTIINYRKSGEISDKVTPLKPLEALLHRKNLICSDVGGYKEILDGDHAVYVQPDSPALLAQAMLEVYLDKHKHQALVNKGFAFVTEKRLWSKNGEKYHELYRGML